MSPIPEGGFPRAPEGERVGDPRTSDQHKIPGLANGPTVQEVKQYARTVPTPGRIVLYRLSKQDVETINQRRNARERALIAAAVEASGGKISDYQRMWNTGICEGDTVPLLIVKAWGTTPDSYANGQAFLDGDDNLWVTSVRSEPGDHTSPRTYSWPHELAAARDASTQGPLR